MALKEPSWNKPEGFKFPPVKKEGTAKPEEDKAAKPEAKKGK